MFINALAGEMLIRICGRRYRLRPSMEALYCMEQSLDAPLPVIMEAVQTGDAPAYWVRQVINEGMRAGGNMPSGFIRWFTGTKHREAQAFLQGVLGKTEKTAAIDWEQTYRLATSLCALSDAEFWHITPLSLSLRLEGAALTYTEANDADYLPATRSELQAMMQQFPDRAETIAEV